MPSRETSGNCRPHSAHNELTHRSGRTRSIEGRIHFHIPGDYPYKLSYNRAYQRLIRRLKGEIDVNIGHYKVYVEARRGMADENRS